MRLRPLLFAVLTLVSGLAMRPAWPQTRGTAPQSFAPLVRRVVPAVVNISVVEQQSAANGDATPEPRTARERGRTRKPAVLGAGSGFIVDPSGIVVTNTHVVARANRISVTLANGTELPATLMGSDELTDLAVLRVSNSAPLPFVEWGDSKAVEVGDWILAAGNPFGVGISVTAGIVSARGRDIQAGPFDDFLQIDAPINPGNSGGPTFNMDGQVVAVNTAIVSPSGGSVGIGFAVPSEIARKIVADLREKGRIDRGWLGVSVEEDESARDLRTVGVAIANIDRSGPAARAGLRPGDVVLAVNGAQVRTAQGLIRAVAATTPGNALRLTVRRGSQSLELPVTVGRRPSTQQG